VDLPPCPSSGGEGRGAIWSPVCACAGFCLELFLYLEGPEYPGTPGVGAVAFLAGSAWSLP
jgi:hypothetical protein